MKSAEYKLKLDWHIDQLNRAATQFKGAKEALDFLIKHTGKDFPEFAELHAQPEPDFDNEQLARRLQSFLDRLCNDNYSATMFEGDACSLREAIEKLRHNHKKSQAQQTESQTKKFCSNCASFRPGDKCHKCGEDTFTPDKRFTEQKLPPIEIIRAIAMEAGYAVAVHGTQERDLDVIAAPWTDDAIGNQELMERIAKGINAAILETERKPLGRYAATIQIDGWYKPLDLSVCPRLEMQKDSVKKNPFGFFIFDAQQNTQDFVLGEKLDGDYEESTVIALYSLPQQSAQEPVGEVQHYASPANLPAYVNVKWYGKPPKNGAKVYLISPAPEGGGK